jgi:hypothetical protein
MNVKIENNDNNNNLNKLHTMSTSSTSNSDTFNDDDNNKMGFLNLPEAKKAISLSGSKFAKQKSIIGLNDLEENEEKMEL